MKKYVMPLIFLSGILIGLSVLLYPRVGKYVNARSQSRVVMQYFDDVAGAEDAETQALLNAARGYNDKLRNNPRRFEFTEEDRLEYEGLLKTGSGAMGVLDIDRINVKLPIYHGTDEGVLQIGIGHLRGSSLPVGGPGTHAIITGHRGVPSSKLLSDLDQLNEGDIFLLYVLGEALTYRVDDIRTVEPDEVRALDIDTDMDYCTLVTCTPYGVNSHRLLVRGRRIENAPDARWEDACPGAQWLEKTGSTGTMRIKITVAFLTHCAPE